MEYSCCMSVNHLGLVAQAGYDGIALPGWFVADCQEQDIKEIREKLEESGLQCHSLNAFCPASIPLVGEEHNTDLLEEYCHRLGANARKLGVRVIGIGSPNSRILPEGYHRDLAMGQWEMSLRTIGDTLARYEIKALAEALCTRECNWMNTTKEMLDVVRQLNHGNLGLVFDIYHAFAMGEGADVLEQAMPYVGLVHIAQSIDAQKHYLRPGYENDYRDYFRTLRNWGYDGEISVEATYDDLSTALPSSLKILKGYTALPAD